jgi:hypothetical protein
LSTMLIRNSLQSSSFVKAKKRDYHGNRLSITHTKSFPKERM